MTRTGLRRGSWSLLTFPLVMLLTLGVLMPSFALNAAAQDRTVVRLAGPPSSPEETRLLEEVLANFEEQFPEIDVNFEPIPSEYGTKLQADLRAGNAADVFYLEVLPAPDLMASGTILALDEYMEASGVSTDDYYEGLMDGFQFDGSVYGLPKDFSTLAMVYDPEAFAAAEIEAAPTTWEELRDVAQRLADAGQPPIVYGPAFDRYIAFHYAGGAEIISEDNEITIDSPEAVEALDFFYGMYEDGLVATFSDVGAQWPGDAFAKGQASIVFEGNWMFPFLEANAPDKAFEIAEMPEGPGGPATMAFTVAYAIAKNSEVPDEAWTLVQYLTGPEGMATWTSLGLAMPARPDLAEDWIALFPEREPFLAGGEYARPWQLGPGGSRFNEEANSQLQLLFAGEQDVAETLANMQSAAEEFITLP
ncbi:MAG: ABC transporter substrate-binding protein [Chloroflexota bacterium]|nr:ABC transporter substrate-binding protein [Chloroflexota bacterium]